MHTELINNKQQKGASENVWWLHLLFFYYLLTDMLSTDVYRAVDTRGSIHSIFLCLRSAPWTVEFMTAMKKKGQN